VFTKSPCSSAGKEPDVAKSIIMENRADISPLTSEEIIRQLTEQVAALKLQVAWYEEQFRRAQQKRFGASSEQTHPDQLTLFNEAEAEADPLAPEPTVETVTVQRRKKAKLANLPVETIHYTLDETEGVCPDCAGPLHAMSTEVRRELKIIPAQVSVVEHVRHVYSCRWCGQTGVRTPVVTAPMPAPALPGSLASGARDPSEIREQLAALPAGRTVPAMGHRPVATDDGQLADRRQ
jgi:hypothetical protein